MKDRDMYYGYGGFTPMQMPGMIQPQMQEMTQPQVSNVSSGIGYGTNQFSDLNDRINRLERQVKRLDQRLTRLETPYANSNNLYNNEPDNNMYMM